LPAGIRWRASCAGAIGAQGDESATSDLADGKQSIAAEQFPIRYIQWGQPFARFAS